MVRNFLLVLFINEQDIFVLDTSHDDDGINHDSEPIQGNGRGSHEANSQSNHLKYFIFYNNLVIYLLYFFKIFIQI